MVTSDRFHETSAPSDSDEIRSRMRSRDQLERVLSGGRWRGGRGDISSGQAFWSGPWRARCCSVDRWLCLRSESSGARHIQDETLHFEEHARFQEHQGRFGHQKGFQHRCGDSVGCDMREFRNRGIRSGRERRQVGGSWRELLIRSQGDASHRGIGGPTHAGSDTAVHGFGGRQFPHSGRGVDKPCGDEHLGD
jgi:hypothetical protein